MLPNSSQVPPCFLLPCPPAQLGLSSAGLCASSLGPTLQLALPILGPWLSLQQHILLRDLPVTQATPAPHRAGTSQEKGLYLCPSHSIGSSLCFPFQV